MFGRHRQTADQKERADMLMEQAWRNAKGRTGKTKEQILAGNEVKESKGNPLQVLADAGAAKKMGEATLSDQVALVELSGLTQRAWEPEVTGSDEYVALDELTGERPVEIPTGDDFDTGLESVLSDQMPSSEV